MMNLLLPPPEARRILKLARHDRKAAGKALAALDPEVQAALICQSPVARRAQLFDLVESPEAVTRHLPPAELCFTARALGLSEAGWLLDCAQPEQLVALVDLDAWTGFEFDRARFDEWLVAFAAADEETLLRASRALDFEVLVLGLRARVWVELRSNADDWEAPAGARTLDGVFHLVARAPNDDLADWLKLLRVLFQSDYWFYFRLLQAGIGDLDTETEAFALRWRRGRLQDFGFPDIEDAKRVYSYLRDEQLARLPDTAPAAEAASSLERPRTAWLPAQLESEVQRYALFRAIARLDPDERAPLQGALLSLANRVALADALPLGEYQTLRDALEKAAQTASRGLEHLARERGLRLEAVLRQVSLERLFQVGHNLERRRRS